MKIHYSALLFITLTFGIYVPAAAQSPTAFNKSVRNYAYVGKTGLNASVTSIRLHLSSNPAQADGAFDTGQAVTFSNVAAQDLNAAGISGKDGYMYALEYLYIGPASQGANLYRVGANAVAERIGIIPGPSNTDAGRTIVNSFVNLASGLVDSAGNYWFTGYTYHSFNLAPSVSDLDFFIGKLSGINVLNAANSGTTLSPTYYKLDISDTTFKRGMTNLMRQQAAMIAYGYSPTNADGGWQDMDINPTNGEIYSYIGFPSATPVVGLNPYPKPAIQSYLARIDNTVTPWKIRIVNAAAPVATPNREEDGAWFDSTGKMYVGFTDGQYARVNLNTGLLDTIAQSSLPLSGNNLRGDFATNTPLEIVPPTMPLPVHLLSFGARPAQNGAEVYWSTGLEEGVSHFEVEHSADGLEFNVVAVMQPRGSNNSYSISDLPLGSTAYYRLRIVDVDGTATYSSIAKWRGKSDAGSSIVIYPSIIANSTLYLDLPPQRVNVHIYTLAGVPVQTASFDGANLHVTMPLSLVAGMYIVHIVDALSGVPVLSGRIVLL